MTLNFMISNLYENFTKLLLKPFSFLANCKIHSDWIQPFGQNALKNLWKIDLLSENLFLHGRGRTAVHPLWRFTGGGDHQVPAHSITAYVLEKKMYPKLFILKEVWKAFLKEK